MQKHSEHFFVEKVWYGRHWLRWLLWPLSCVYRIVVALRRQYLLRVVQTTMPIPVIVVGNITVGGVGKTPLVVAIVEQLQARGLRVGIVSRGYGATVVQFPHEVLLHEPATLVGDEPLLLAKKTRCPVVIAPNRVQAVQYLLDKHQSQVVVSDDGLQHYALGRAIDIAVVDGVRGFGNGLCVPAGPLREPINRLQHVDFVVVNGGPGLKPSTVTYPMTLQPGELTHLVSGQTLLPAQLPTPIAAFAAIGHPQRFFSTLQELGLSFKAYPFADHHSFVPNDLCVEEKAVVMTEKDAVKCQPFATDSMCFLPVDAALEDKFWNTLWLHERLQGHL